MKRYDGVDAHSEHSNIELSAAERHEILVEWNDTRTDYPKDKCIHQLFEEQVERTPDAIAVVFGGQRLTYQALNRRANRLARHLQSFGVEPEVLVGICVERSLEMIVGLLAILKAGGAYVPLNPSYPKERIAFMPADAEVGLFLTQERLVGGLPEHRARIVGLDADWEDFSEENPVSQVSPESLAYVIHTSASTGRSKGVLIPHRGVVNLVSWHREAFAGNGKRQIDAIGQSGVRCARLGVVALSRCRSQRPCGGRRDPYIAPGPEGLVDRDKNHHRLYTHAPCGRIIAPEVAGGFGLANHADRWGSASSFSKPIPRFRFGE
uniref:AMP-binding enzyme n=1 Tax=Candidatus Kentrum sp. TC TaxID=2126339 RepID=A0A450YJ44_9GAMM|nr:MAG: AMP-binding enzyme [Candidatus Kentron sp. TC]